MLSNWISISFSCRAGIRCLNSRKTTCDSHGCVRKFNSYMSKTVGVYKTFQMDKVGDEVQVSNTAVGWTVKFTLRIIKPNTYVFNADLTWSNPGGGQENKTGVTVSVNKGGYMILSNLFGYNSSWRLHWTDTGFVVK